MTPRNNRGNNRGFSLLEMTLSLALSGVMLAGLWQMMGMVAQLAEANALATHSQSAAYAAHRHINSQRSAILPLVPALGDVVQLRVMDGDAGAISVSSLQSSGTLPAGFNNRNSYGQSYTLYVQRQDAGPAGADDQDRLVGLLITTGGNRIADRLGDRILGRIGAAGGFLYADANPAEPTAATTARGLAGGWQIELNSTGWSSVGSTATAGRLAILISMLPASGGGSGGASRLNDLDDASTNVATSFNFYIGHGVGSGTSSGQNNTGLGALALQAVSTGGANAAYGAQALRYLTIGNNNTAIGNYALYANQTGSSNTALGTSALHQNVSGNNNIAIGTSAGPAAGHGNLEGTIAIGSNVQVSNSYTLNIANSFYGNLAHNSFGIGALPASGISLDAGGQTDSIRPARGGNAQRPSCDHARTGAMRWNTDINAVEFCDGAGWVTPLVTSASGSPPATPPGTGYIVLTNTAWNGNLGGNLGADAKCFLELTVNILWKGHLTALASLKLLPGNVHAWLPGRNFIPMGTYAFARVGSLTAGGGTLTVGPDASGPNNIISWAAINYFGGTFQYWTGAAAHATSTWGNHAAASTCNNWTSSNAGVNGTTGSSSNTDHQRWAQADISCNTPLPLICYVDP